MFFTFDILLAQKTDNSHTQDKKKTLIALKNTGVISNSFYLYMLFFKIQKHGNFNVNLIF